MEIYKKFEGVYAINGNLATKNLKPQKNVYGEKIIEINEKEFRIWDPRRSKLSAAIKNGIKIFPFSKHSKVLYLGASAGTTPSHISDIISEGLIYCIEFSPTMMRKLLELCKIRKNMIPVLEDAAKPWTYVHLIPSVDSIYCDVAQSNQLKIFLDNIKLFLKDEGYGIIMIKSRSIDVTKNPKEIFNDFESKIKSNGFKIIEKLDLNPFAKAHRALIIKKIF
jgi:fibrillarin-like pre-rRNA processing protein